MKSVQISFEYEGKIYTGLFNPARVGGAGVCHLMINKFYIGVSVLTENYVWQFHG